MVFSSYVEDSPQLTGGCFNPDPTQALLHEASKWTG